MAKRGLNPANVKVDAWVSQNDAHWQGELQNVCFGRPDWWRAEYEAGESYYW